MGRIRKIGSAHCNYSQILYQFLTFTQNLKRSLLFRLFSFFLLRCNFVAWVNCHAHADQRATSEILVSLHQFLAACVEASCHTGKCTEWPIFMCFHFVCSPYLLSVFWAIPRFPFYSPAVLPFYYRVLPLRSLDNGQVVPRQRSSSGRHRKSSSRTASLNRFALTSLTFCTTSNSLARPGIP